MTNIDRIKLELGGKSYFEDEALETLLIENNLEPSDDYDPKSKKLLLQAVYDVLSALTNSLDIYMKIETEFSNTSTATKHLQDRLNALERRINAISDDADGAQKSAFNFMFYS